MIENWQHITVLVGLIFALFECILLRRRVRKLEGTSDSYARKAYTIAKTVRQDFSMFANKQRYINHSLDRRIVRDAERAQKTKQALSSLKRDVMLNDGLVKDT